jgi:hypothetical protein
LILLIAIVQTLPNRESPDTVVLDFILASQGDNETVRRSLENMAANGKLDRSTCLAVPFFLSL